MNIPTGKTFIINVFYQQGHSLLICYPLYGVNFTFLINKFCVYSVQGVLRITMEDTEMRLHLTLGLSSG